MKLKLPATLVGTLLACSLLSAERPARAYVRSVTSKGMATAWSKSRIDLKLYVGDPPPNMGTDGLSRAVHAAAATWSTPAVSCAGISLVVEDVKMPIAPAEYDSQNLLGFRRDQWRKMPCTPSDKELCSPYSALAIAITTVTSNTRTGEILDADMEINEVQNIFADVLLDGAKLVGTAHVQDLQNTVTHELGHLIGLDHNCYGSIPATGIPLDGRGEAAPSCVGAGPEITDATMFGTAGERETKKRDLAPDDLQAVCDVYPVGYQGLPVLDDANDKTGGCMVANRPGSTAPAPAGLAGLALLLGGALLRTRGGRRFRARRPRP